LDFIDFYCVFLEFEKKDECKYAKNQFRIQDYGSYYGVTNTLTLSTNLSKRSSYHSPIDQKRSYNDAEGRGRDTRNVL